MSVLETPRIYFKGQVSWDPIVTNNYQNFYDEDASGALYPTPSEGVRRFREKAIAGVGQGNWNPHGTHRVRFFETEVNGFDQGKGTETKDPFVSAAVNLQGMLVDLEPFGSSTSQLFFDSLCLGVDGGYRIYAPRHTRFTARYINFRRNSFNRMIAGVASVVWHTTFLKSDGLRVDAYDSGALQALEKALQGNDVLGLTVQFNAYRTVYFDDASLRNGAPATRAAQAALQAKLRAGGFQPNPARSLVVGVLGLWRKGEPVTEPGDRTLVPVNSALGAVHARMDGTQVTLDLSNSIPEVDGALTKQDLGTLQLVAVNGPASTAVASLDYAQYGRDAYEATAGIVTLPMAAGSEAAAATGDLQLQDSTGTVLLGELALRAIPMVPNFYTEAAATAAAVSCQVYERGVAAKGGVPVMVYPVDTQGNVLGGPRKVLTDGDGVAVVPVSTAGTGVTGYLASTSAADQADQGLNTQVTPYFYARVLAKDAEVAAMEPTWENVFREVLANWKAMAPCMDNWLNLEDPEQVRAYGALIKKLTDPARVEDFRYMPVTRDMTPGMRTLLYRFLDGETGVVESLGGEERKAPLVDRYSRGF